MSPPLTSKDAVTQITRTQFLGSIVTFYSYKGGVGRSMALGNVAEILANAGYRVVVCDWDLEAPGLERYLFDDPVTAERHRACPGIIDLVLEYKVALASPVQPHDNKSPQDPAPDPEQFERVGNLWLRRPSSYAVTIPSDDRSGGGWIKFLPAGRRDGEWNRKYTEAIRDFGWPEFYDKWAGDAYFEFFRAELTEDADFILIDSRTGVTELGGVCTHHLADLVVLFSAANDLNVEGTKWMAEILSGSAIKSVRGEREAVAIVPVASRIEQRAETVELQKFRERFIGEFARYLPQAGSPSSVFSDRQTFLANTEIPYFPVFSYRESVVARLPREKRLYANDLYGAYAKLADGLVDWAAQHRGLRALQQLALPPQVGVATVSSGSTLVPKGRFFVSYALGNEQVAGKLCAGLQAAGVDIWCYPMTAPSGIETGVMQQVQRAFGESNGCLLLLGPNDPSAWVETELSAVLARRVADRAYRAVVLTQADLDTSKLEARLSQYAVVRLPPSPDHSTFDQICAELLAEQPLPLRDNRTTLGGVDIAHPAQALFFLGRESEVGELVGQADRAMTQLGHCLVITGPEGSGKTSLISAGLQPALHRGWLGATRSQPCVVTFSPEGDAAARLARALADAMPGPSAPEIEKAIRAGESFSKFVVEHFSQQRPLILIMDSAEALFNESQGRAQERFLASLDSCLQHSECLFVVVGIRSDALGAWQQSPLGRRLTADALYRVPPISELGMRRYLGGSARLAGVAFEAGLEERMVSDLAREKACIADVAFVLRQLATSLQENRLTHEAYNRVGGLGGVLAERARHVLRDLDPARGEIARRILLALVEVRSNERKWLPRDEVLRAAGGGPEVEVTFNQLRQARVIMLNEEGRAGLAHEAILRLQLVREWIAKDYEALKRRDALQEAAEEWQKTGRPDRKLPPPPQIERYQEIPGKTPLATEFLGAAELLQRRKGVRRFVLGALKICCLIVAGAMTYLLDANRRAELRTLNHQNQALVDKVNEVQAENQDLQDSHQTAQEKLQEQSKLRYAMEANLKSQLALFSRADLPIGTAQTLSNQAWFLLQDINKSDPSLAPKQQQQQRPRDQKAKAQK